MHRAPRSYGILKEEVTRADVEHQRLTPAELTHSEIGADYIGDFDQIVPIYTDFPGKPDPIYMLEMKAVMVHLSRTVIGMREIANQLGKTKPYIHRQAQKAAQSTFGRSKKRPGGTKHQCRNTQKFNPA